MQLYRIVREQLAGEWQPPALYTQVQLCLDWGKTVHTLKLPIGWRHRRPYESIETDETHLLAQRRYWFLRLSVRQLGRSTPRIVRRRRWSWGVRWFLEEPVPVPEAVQHAAALKSGW